MQEFDIGAADRCVCEADGEDTVDEVGEGYDAVDPAPDDG